MVFVKNRESNPKIDKDDSPYDLEQKLDVEDEDDAEEGILAAPQQQPTSIPSAMEPMPMPTSRPMQDHHLFPLPESLNFGEPARQDRSYYDFTPTAQPFEYLSQTPFSASTEEHRHTSMPVQPPVTQFDPWGPSFRPNLFDYGTTAATTTQTMPPPSLPYHMPLPTDLPHPSHTSGVAHF